MAIEKLIIRTGQQICRPFQLHMRGKVLVRTGQRVAMGEPVAEYYLPESYIEYDISSGFKVKPAKAESHIKRLVGEMVEEGDVIAMMGGVFQRIFRAPQAGRVIAIRNGKIMLALGNVKHVCRAGFPGLVVELLPDRGAVICATGSVLQGLWGNGKNAHGDLAFLGGSDQNPFNQEAINSKMEGKVIVTGPCLKKQLLERMVDARVAGVIVSSLAPTLQAECEQLEFPFMSLAGFGDIQVDEYSEAMILSMMGRQVFLNAHLPDPMTGMKPEVIMLGEEGAADVLFQDEFAFHIGARVRLTGKPYTGSVGEIIDLPAEEERYASGLVLPSAVVKRSDEQVIRVPLSNIELIY